MTFSKHFKQHNLRIYTVYYCSFDVSIKRLIYSGLNPRCKQCWEVEFEGADWTWGFLIHERIHELMTLLTNMGTLGSRTYLGELGNCRHDFSRCAVPWSLILAYFCVFWLPWATQPPSCISAIEIVSRQLETRVKDQLENTRKKNLPMPNLNSEGNLRTCVKSFEHLLPQILN